MTSTPAQIQGSTRPEIVAIIPARLGSTRFPGKVLAAETGKPLIQHVVERAWRSSRLSRVIVATDDDRVASAVSAFGGEIVMTRADHPNGTSRLGEAAARLNLKPHDIIVNVQGDEPEIESEAIDAAIAALGESSEARAVSMATIAVPFGPGEDPRDPNCVKVVLDQHGRALYFSRALIPHDRDKRGDAPAPLRHVGLYVYRRAFLERYLTLSPTPLERSEQLEQLRVLEHGYAIGVAIRAHANVGIDTPEQYRAFVERFRQSNL